MQQERAAADARGLGLHQAEDHLHRHGCVDRRAAAAQHLRAGFGGERMRGGDKRALRILRGAGQRNNEERPRLPSRGYTIRGTMSSATMLMILMSGLTAGPAVSL